MSHASRRVATFRSSFVAVVGAFSALEGCSAVLDPTGGTLDPALCDQPFSTPGCLPTQPDDDCPAGVPDFYAPCAQEGMYCEYGSCYGDPTTLAYCRGGAWIGSVTSCNPPAPPDLPPTVTPPPDAGCPVTGYPTPGTACVNGAECHYDLCQGYPTKTFQCVNGVWGDVLQSSCNPPPPPAPCPLDLPADGTFCTTVDVCSYPFCDSTITASCVDFAWRAPVPSCNPPPPECPDAGPGCEPVAVICPDTQPVADTVCIAGAGTCHYGQFDASCTTGQWNVFVSPLYNPPAPTPCPTSLPLQGTTCAHIGPSCGYGNCVSGYEVDCVNGSWDLHALTCSP